jgi:hypothetical protein
VRIIRKIIFWLVFLAFVFGVISYVPVLQRDPAKLTQNVNYKYGSYIRNGFLPVPVYEWVIPGMTDGNPENSARYQFKCWILPLEKYLNYSDDNGGTGPWIHGYVEPGIYYVTTTVDCIGNAQPKYAFKFYP